MMILKTLTPSFRSVISSGFQSIRFTRAFLGLYIYIQLFKTLNLKLVISNYDFFKTYTLRILKKISAKIKTIAALLSKYDKSQVTCVIAANVVYYTPVSLVAVFTISKGQAYPACPFFCLSESK